MPNTIVHFEIPADDPEKLAGFYRQLFGWKIEHQPQGDYWLIETVPTNEQGQPKEPGVNGGMMKRMAPGQQIVNYVGVESVDEYVKKAQGLGATVVMPKQAVPHVGWFAMCIDPQGNVFAMFQDDPQAG